MRTHQRAQLGGQRGASRRSSAARTLHLLMANLDVTDAELAHRLSTSRQTINSRRKGRVAMTAEDLAELALALDVDPALFLGQPSDAVRWLVDHQAERLDALEPVTGRRGELSTRVGGPGLPGGGVELHRGRRVLPPVRFLAGGHRLFTPGLTPCGSKAGTATQDPRARHRPALLVSA